MAGLGFVYRGIGRPRTEKIAATRGAESQKRDISHAAKSDSVAPALTILGAESRLALKS
jgi:hypothetical protein